jgi:hypothetical protein
MTSDSRTPIDQLAKEIESHVDLYAAAGNANHRFAFWHDVGVTGLGALATTLLGVAEIADDSSISKLLRVFVLFVTGSVTVFAACEQFFKFKAKAQAYHSAAAQLMSLQRRLGRESRGTAVSTERVDRLFEDLDAVVGSVEPIWRNATVWKSPTLRTYGVIAVLVFVVALLAFVFRAVALLPAQ